MHIIRNKKRLRIPTHPCQHIGEGIEIGKKLIKTLNSVGGIGLSANQIGILKSVCVVSAKKGLPPLILINPRYVNMSDDKVAYYESCLSLPGKSVKTVRHKTVSIECDNHEHVLTFGPDSEELTPENYWKDEGLLETVCVQHEMDHLNGQLITDVSVRMPITENKSTKTGRNEKIMMKRGEKTTMVKYKKAKNLLKNGWEII